jgi:tetratricopeptide (TPR) repeat protein
VKKKDLALDLLEMALLRKDEPVALASALIALDRLAAQRPDHALAHYASGRILLLLGRYQLALGAFRVASECDPELYEAHYYEGISHWMLGYDERALDKLGEASALAPERFEPWYDRGQILANNGAHELALEAFTRAHELAPDDFPSLKKLLQAQIRAGQWEAARLSHAELRRLWATSSDPSLTRLESFVLDQFEVGERDVLALETFVPRGDPQVLISFAVTEGGRLVFSVNLESSAALRAAGYGWVLVVQEGDLRVNSDVRYYERPGYPILRSDVEVIIRHWA